MKALIYFHVQNVPKSSHLLPICHGWIWRFESATLRLSLHPTKPSQRSERQTRTDSVEERQPSPLGYATYSRRINKDNVSGHMSQKVLNYDNTAHSLVLKTHRYPQYSTYGFTCPCFIVPTIMTVYVRLLLRRWMWRIMEILRHWYSPDRYRTINLAPLTLILTKLLLQYALRRWRYGNVRPNDWLWNWTTVYYDWSFSAQITICTQSSTS